ncbi:MAG: hypothetical protein BGN88_06070 [Clostridiales bacterium 43-6]|nr:MAG: hypothetical protein BGN88_06070 [Clostridiales bacterium 43-6]
MRNRSVKAIALFLSIGLLLLSAGFQAVSAATVGIICALPNRNGIISGLDVKKNTLTEFQSNFSTSGDVAIIVKNKDGKTLTVNDRVGNEAVVSAMSNGVEIKSYKVVLFGDPTGDGSVNVMDLLALKLHMLKRTPLAGDAFLSANINRDSKLDVFDFVDLKKHVLKVKYVNQSYDLTDYVTKTFDMQESQQFVRPLGRTDLSGTSLALEWTCTGIEFNVTCEGDVVMNYSWTKNPGMFTVVIDDKENEAKQYQVQAISGGELKIASALPKGRHKIKVIKLTEPSEALANINSLKFNGEFDDKPLEKQLKLEFYGDSITCGYGNMSPTREKNGQVFGYIEDGYNTYASIAARNLNADFNVVAMSGWGIAAGWSGSTGLIPLIYDRTVYSNANKKWDFNQYQPDVVVINLSTNDSYFYDNAKANFRSYAAQFLTNLRTKYPNAYILWVGGMMGASKFNTEIDQAMLDAGGTKMIRMKNDLPLSNTALDWHPSVSGHQAAATELTKEIKTILGIQ